MTLRALLEEADFVSLHCDLNPTSFHLIGRDELAVMRRSAYLINTARGPVIGRIVWKLRIPCGSLAVEGGLDPRGTDEDDFVQFVDVPPGDYRVEVLTYLHGINGDYCIDEFLKEEPLGTWFRRTRPDTPMPMWMKLALCEYPEWGPGHEEEWEKFDEYLDGLSMKNYDKLIDDCHTIGFVVRLTPLEDDAMELEIDDDGWFAIDKGARKPERCPLGIPSESA